MYKNLLITLNRLLHGTFNWNWACHNMYYLCYIRIPQTDNMRFKLIIAVIKHSHQHNSLFIKGNIAIDQFSGKSEMHKLPLLKQLAKL